MSLRKNEKISYVSKDKMISKSNELSLSSMYGGLTLQQIQLLCYAIYCTQQRRTSAFKKHEFEKFYDLSSYNTSSAKEDVEKLMKLDFKMQDLGSRGFRMFHVFSGISYVDGEFNFNWTEEMLPHILELKERFILLDLSVTSKFASSFTWRLYEYLKGKHGFWHVSMTREELLEFFQIAHLPTYQNANNFKKRVLERAIKEINNYTEYEIYYTETRKGNKVVGYELIWSKGEIKKMASEQQLETLNQYLDMTVQDAYLISDLPEKQLQQALTHFARIKELKQLIKEKRITERDYHTYYTEVKGILKEFQEFLLL